MADQKNRWSWEVPGFEQRNTVTRADDYAPPYAPLSRRYSISTASVLPHSEPRKHVLSPKLQKLKDKVKLATKDYLALKQETVDLQEYSIEKLEQLTHYLGVLADKTRKSDQAALETEARIIPLVNEKKRLFDELLTSEGNIKIYCRTRPLFEEEGSSVVEFLDELTIRINTADDYISNPKKYFEFDRVYGPHVGQAEVFSDVKPFVQSALDGHNVSIFAYGQTGSGKTHTMEGSSQDCGLYTRCFEELFDLSNIDTTSSSGFDFSVSVSELYNEQIKDMLSTSNTSLPKVRIGSTDFFVDLIQEKAENPLDFSRVLKVAFQNRGTDMMKINASHLIITIHIYHNNLITGESSYSKLSLVDLPGSESLIREDDSGERATDVLHVMKSLSALGDVLTSLASKKDDVPYTNSILTKILADSLGRSSKILLIANVCPNASNLSETLSSLSFASRARNATLSLGDRDTIEKWKDIANDSRKELYNKEEEFKDMKQEILGLKQSIKRTNDQSILLFNEVQRAWKVSFTLQSDLKSENIMLSEKCKIENDQNAELSNQVARLLQSEQDQKLQIKLRDSTIEALQEKLKTVEGQLSEAVSSTTPVSQSSPNSTGDNMDYVTVAKKLEEELKKRDALIEKLHEENEKLFDRLTEKANSVRAPQVLNPSKGPGDIQSRNVVITDSNNKGRPLDVAMLPSPTAKNESTVAVVKSGGEKTKTTPAGEYLTSALNDFDPEHHESLAAVSDGANKLLMLVLAAVIKAGASREHEILAEIRDAVFSFIHKMEPKRVMDTMLVSRVRILYIRSLLARSPELQSVKVSPVERFLEKAHTGQSRSSSRGSSPGRSPVRYDSSLRNALVDHQQIQAFRVNLKPEKKSKLSSVVLKIRGIDQETWRQHVTGGKLREIAEEAKSFAIGNKTLAALFVHTPAGELQRQIRSWLAENFDFLSVTRAGGEDSVVGGSTTGQLELLSTAIMDGWMAGLGAAQPLTTDALGLVLVEYAKRVYNSQLQHLKDIAGTLSAEAAEDSSQVMKLRSALESVGHKRRKILQQMRSDVALLTLESGGSPIRNPSTAAEDARLASLISLDSIMKQLKDIVRQSSVNKLSPSKKKALLETLDELNERMPSLLDIDHPCAQRQIAEVRYTVESIPDEEESILPPKQSLPPVTLYDTEIVVTQWNVLQFNTGSTTPFIIKCGANSNSELVIKAEARVQEPKGGEIVRVVPRPTSLENMSLEEMKEVFNNLPEALSILALARTADGTRARYSRLYRTLAMKVSTLRDLVEELEKGGGLKDVIRS